MSSTRTLINIKGYVLTIDSVCTYCGVGCDISAEVENNEIKKIFAKKEGVVSRGKLCIKGKDGYDFVNSPNRIRAPRVKKSFIQDSINHCAMPLSLQDRLTTLKEIDDEWYESDLEFAYDIVAWKVKELKSKYSGDIFGSMGGARTSCESSYTFQKFVRKTLESANVDSCARICHAPSLRGMRETIGEGAATSPFDDILNAEHILIIGSNTTEAHPIASYRVLEAQKSGTTLSVIDVRSIPISKKSDFECIIPHESNLMILNSLAYVILKEELYNKEFIDSRCKYFDEYKESILSDKYANPEIYKSMKGYEYLADMIPSMAREYASKKSMILWGLGVTEHIDGSFAVMAITHLALLTGNIGKSGTGLMPMRGQNNVQGTCDMGCLPYYTPDYQHLEKAGLMTPDMIEAMYQGKIKGMFNMGEDIAHVHPNQNKINKALDNLELIVVQELFMTEIAKRADVVFGVKSAYEKSGVYVNAERRLHLSQPLVESDLPDDWEVLSEISKRVGNDLQYNESQDVWDEVREVAQNRYSGASYEKLRKNQLRGLQWPVFEEDTPILHLESFRTKDGLGRFKYHQIRIRGMLKELLDGSFANSFYLTTGRVMAHYNNSAQTQESAILLSKYTEDLILVSEDDREFFADKDRVTLVSEYGKSASLPIKIVSTIKKGTMFTTFHFSKSKINYLFGDEADEFVKTSKFKSVKVSVE
jgi:formate dehydrogenase major subunit